MSATPRVSVVIPAFNAASTIAEAIESVLAQDYAETEVIVVDDGSTDDTPRIVQAFGPPVRLIRQENRGPAVARNAALAAASGELIAFLDADDVWLPGKLHAQVEYLRTHPQVGVVYGRWVVWRPFTPRPDVTAQLDDSAPKTIEQDESGWLYTRLLADCILLTSTVMVRSDLTRQVGEFDVALKRGQDYDYWLRISRVCEIHKLARPLALYRVEGSNIMRLYPNENYSVTVLTSNVARFGLVNPDGNDAMPRSRFNARLAKEWLSFGRHHLRTGNAARARQAFAASLRYAPWRLKTYALFAASYLPRSNAR